jgi:hypothetical protein
MFILLQLYKHFYHLRAADTSSASCSAYRTVTL